jgi:hypothetical protein
MGGLIVIYAQFYTMSTGYVAETIPPRFDDAHKRPIEACGDRGIVFIDARLKPETIGEIARRECEKRGYIGYRIYKGARLDDAKPISGYWPVAASGKVDTLHRVLGM